MKLVSFSVSTVVGETVRIGALIEDDRIVDLNMGYARYLKEGGTTGRPYEVAAGIMPTDMVEFFKGGKLSREEVEKCVNFVLDRLEKDNPSMGLKEKKSYFSWRR